MEYKVGDRLQHKDDAEKIITIKGFNKFNGMYIGKAEQGGHIITDAEGFKRFGYVPISGLPSKATEYTKATEYSSEVTESPYSYENAIESMIGHCGQILLKKHKEYATEDEFHNFNVAAALQDVTPQQALIGMMDKHVVSVHDLVNEHAEGRNIPADVWREKIGDNINYLLILWAMVEKGLADGTDIDN